MPLLNLTKKVHDTFGLAHATNLATLRHYLKTTNEDKLVREILEFKDVALLRNLWEAGLSSRLQEVVLDKLKRLS